MELIPIERGTLKCLFRYPEQDGVPGETYATLSVIGLLMRNHSSAHWVTIMPVVLDDQIMTAGQFCEEHRTDGRAGLEYEVFEPRKGPEGDSDTKSPFWFHVFFSAYINGTPLDFHGVEVPEYVTAKLKYAVATGALTQLKEESWIQRADLMAAQAAVQEVAAGARATQVADMPEQRAG